MYLSGLRKTDYRGQSFLKWQPYNMYSTPCTRNCSTNCHTHYTSGGITVKMAFQGPLDAICRHQIFHPIKQGFYKVRDSHLSYNV